MVQGCWGIIPAHLNEISPPEARGTFPGFVYQLGNFLASYNATLQAGIAVTYGSYGTALALVAAAAAIGIAVFAFAGREAKDVDMAAREPRILRCVAKQCREDQPCLMNTSTRSGSPLSAPPMARTSIRSDGTPRSIRSWRMVSARLSDSRRASEDLSLRAPP